MCCAFCFSRHNKRVNEETRQQLQLIASTGTPPFAETAEELLRGKLELSAKEIDQFIDSFMNDPYLTRNSSTE